jgi:general L-amino acid transport system substrate-binding protein
MNKKHLLRWAALALGVLALFAVACASDDDADSGDGDGDTAITAQGETLQTVIDRGELKCGVKNSQAGMGNLESDGTFTGFDIEICKALAAAIFGDSSKVDYVPASAGDRFELLGSGEIDVLIRTTTNTFSRDVDLSSTFAPTTFYDGQGMMVKADSGFMSIGDLDGATICVTTGTTTEQNLDDTFAALGISYTPLAIEDDAGSQENFLADRCDGWTGDRSNLAAQKSVYPADGGGPDALRVLPEVMSKEPLGPVTRDGDPKWSELVGWTVYAMISAEENGLNSGNVSAQAGSPSTAEIGRILGIDLAIGTLLGLDRDTFMQDVIAQVGNYGEAYDRTIGLLLPREGSANALWTNGGLIYAPPVR